VGGDGWNGPIFVCPSLCLRGWKTQLAAPLSNLVRVAMALLPVVKKVFVFNFGGDWDSSIF
jgi:hypothetical protein